MDVIEAIKTRRSIRRFKKEPLDKNLILKVIDAARYAPSSRNSQPWEFIVVQRPETLARLSEIHRYAWLIKDAPAAIIVLANESLSPLRYPQDTSAAIQNMLLAAHSLGLGTCWVAVYSTKDRDLENKVREVIELPEDRRAMAIIAMGYPDYQPAEKKLRSLDEVVHWEKF